MKMHAQKLPAKIQDWQLNMTTPNLADLAKGSLPEDVVEMVEAAWLEIKGVAPKY